MILMSQGLIQALIVVGVVILFLITFILNKKTKAPKGVEVPEKCISCPSNTCIVKISDLDKIKEELKSELDKCENNEE